MAKKKGDSKLIRHTYELSHRQKPLIYLGNHETYNSNEIFDFDKSLTFDITFEFAITSNILLFVFFLLNFALIIS